MNVREILQGYERIGVVGMGATGLSAASFLRHHGLQPVLFDTRADIDVSEHASLQQCEHYFGEFSLEDMLSLDLAIMSPGIAFTHPALLMARDAGVQFISDIELFAWLVDVPVLGVTGSNGKSTVASLAAHMLKATGRKPGLGGNIGTPALDLLRNLPEKEFDCIVLELSSFQLEQTSNLKLAAAAVLNISPDHMDRYPDLAAYARVKNRIYRNSDVCIYNREDKLTRPLRTRAMQLLLNFGQSTDESNFSLEMHEGEEFITYSGQPLIASSDLPMPGDYNKVNCMAALALVAAVGTDLEDAAATIINFKPLAHRCQLVGTVNGVRWVNDSKATNVGAVQAAVEGLRGEVSGKLILIAGGDAKGADLSPLKTTLEMVDTLITLGQDGPHIAALKAGAIEVESLQQAVIRAANEAGRDSLVLLSPACASLDMFKDYKQRGDIFTASVEALNGSS